MADISTLVDDFSGTALGGQWSGSAAVAGGEVDTTTSPIVSVATYTVANPSELVVAVGASGWAGDPDKVFVGVENTSGTRVGLGTNGAQDRWRIMLYDATYTIVGSIRTAANSHKWAKLRFLGVDTEFYTSPDGVTWTLDSTHADSNWAADHFNGRKVRLAQADYTQIGVAAGGAAFPFFLLGGSMSAVQIRRNEATASLRRIPLWIYDDTADADPWAGSVTGLKAKLSTALGSEGDSPADIVRVAGALHYVELAQTYTDIAEGSTITARVPAASGRRESLPAGAQIIPADSYVTGITETGLKNSLVRAMNGADGYIVRKNVAEGRIELVIPSVGTVNIPATFSEASVPVDAVGE
jgi:hypothetical protein